MPKPKKVIFAVAGPSQFWPSDLRRQSRLILWDSTQGTPAGLPPGASEVVLVRGGKRAVWAQVTELARRQGLAVSLRAKTLAALRGHLKALREEPLRRREAQADLETEMRRKALLLAEARLRELPAEPPPGPEPEPVPTLAQTLERSADEAADIAAALRKAEAENAELRGQERLQAAALARLEIEKKELEAELLKFQGLPERLREFQAGLRAQRLQSGRAARLALRLRNRNAELQKQLRRTRQALRRAMSLRKEVDALERAIRALQRME